MTVVRLKIKGDEEEEEDEEMTTGDEDDGWQGDEDEESIFLDSLMLFCVFHVYHTSGSHTPIIITYWIDNSVSKNSSVALFPKYVFGYFEMTSEKCADERKLCFELTEDQVLTMGSVGWNSMRLRRSGYGDWLINEKYDQGWAHIQCFIGTLDV